MYTIRSRCGLKKAVIITLLAIAITFSFSFLGTGSVANAEDSTPAQNGTYRAASDVKSMRVLPAAKKKLFTIPSTYYFEITDYYTAFN